MKKLFTGEKAFEALYKAEAWLKEQGYFCAPLERDAPVGISKEDWIGGYKWRNLYQKGKNALDGIIDKGDKRNGDLTVIIFDSEDANKYYCEER